MCNFCETFNFGGVGYDFPDYAGGAAGRIYFPGKIGDVPEDQRFKFCPVCGEPLTEEHFKPILFLHYQGCDSMDRPMYKAGGRFYVDTEPVSDVTPPAISTKSGNDFDGEPEDPVKGRFVFVPKRDTWH